MTETERSAKKARLKKMKTEADELQATFVQDATSLDAGASFPFSSHLMHAKHP